MLSFSHQPEISLPVVRKLLKRQIKVHRLLLTIPDLTEEEKFRHCKIITNAIRERYRLASLIDGQPSSDSPLTVE